VDSHSQDKPLQVLGLEIQFPLNIYQMELQIQFHLLMILPLGHKKEDGGAVGL
jgi:hypothetical protein